MVQTRQPSAARRGARRVAEFREGVRRRPGGSVAWRVGVTVVGVALIVVGAVLLALPGPGWLIIFAGLGVLGTEYHWARRLLSWLRGELRRWKEWLSARPRWLQALIGLSGFVVLVAVGYAAWLLYR